MILRDNELTVSEVRSMVPFLQNSNNLRELDLDGNNIQSEGFNVLFQALGNSPIEELSCRNCGRAILH
jgi:Ran GTPase-activating protein (RanGAP) involved in mRNA processing and transport